MKANERIHRAMAANEKWVLGVIREMGVYRPFSQGITTLATWNALDRLEAKGKVRYSRMAGGYIMKKKA